MIPVYKPYLPTQCLKYAHEALDSTWLSSQGKFLPMVTEKLQELLNVKYVIPLNNGTSACHLVAKTLHRARPAHVGKKKILVPDNVYVAAWNAFLFDKEYELIPVESDINTWNYDLDSLEKTLSNNWNADILVVHNIGNVINVPALQRKYPGNLIVEDNCEGFLGKYENQQTGTASFASAISFFGNKNITSGEGGAFVTNSEDAYLYAKCVQGQGQSHVRFVHRELGYNYRMTNIQAAILYGQLEVLPDILSMKQSVFDTYRRAFDGRVDIKTQVQESHTHSANWMFGVRIPGASNYEEVEKYFKMRGIEVRPMFYPISDHAHLLSHPDVRSVDSTVARLLNKECFILPSYPELNTGDQNHIIYSVNEYLKTLGK